jgi:hypothetical protein
VGKSTWYHPLLKGLIGQIFISGSFFFLNFQNDKKYVWIIKPTVNSEVLVHLKNIQSPAYAFKFQKNWFQKFSNWNIHKNGQDYQKIYLKWLIDWLINCCWTPSYSLAGTQIQNLAKYMFCFRKTSYFEYFSSVPVLHYLQSVLFLKIWTFCMNTLCNTLWN